MHCNLVSPEPRQLFPAIITMPCQVWSRWTYPLPYYSVLLLLHYFTLWHWPLTFDLKHLRIASNRLWRDETLYQIWTQSSNAWRSYCDFSVWHYDLEHCVTFCARHWENFHQVWLWTTYPCMNYSVFYADTLCHAVTLTFDPLTLKVRGTPSITWSKSVRNFSEIEQSRLNYW